MESHVLRQDPLRMRQEDLIQVLHANDTRKFETLDLSNS